MTDDVGYDEDAFRAAVQTIRALAAVAGGYLVGCALNDDGARVNYQYTVGKGRDRKPVYGKVPLHPTAPTPAPSLSNPPTAPRP